MRIRLNLVEQENQKLSILNNNLEEELKSRPKRGRPPSAKKEDLKNKQKIDLNQQKQNDFSMNVSGMGTTDEILNNLCEYCIKKNINLKKHLQRYDISKNGKIRENDFRKAIEELKLGFINNDLDKLANTCKSPHSKDISIDNFLNILKNKNANFKKYMEQLSDDIIKYDNKQVSRKYDKFENKTFNIDY